MVNTLPTSYKEIGIKIIKIFYRFKFIKKFLIFYRLKFINIFCWFKLIMKFLTFLTKYFFRLKFINFLPNKNAIMDHILRLFLNITTVIEIRFVQKYGPHFEVIH